MPLDSSIETTETSTPEIETGEFAFAIKLPSIQAEKADAMSKLLASNLELEPSKNIWHVTLFHGSYKISDIPKIIDVLKELASSITQFDITFTHGYVTANRWVDWKVEDTDLIHSIHRMAVEKLHDFTEGRKLARSSDPLVYDDPRLAPEKKLQIDKFGVTGIDSEEGNFYNPHTTLLYQYPPLEKLNGSHEALELDGKRESAHIVEFIFGKLGFNGNILEEVETFALAESHDDTSITGQLDHAGLAAGFDTGE